MQDCELLTTIHRASKDAGEAFGALSHFVVKASDHLRAGEIAEGNGLLARVLDDFSHLACFLSDVTRSSAFRAGRGQEEINEIEKESLQMGELLRTASEALENRDWIFLADLLEYEFSQKLGSWQGLVTGLSTAAEAGAIGTMAPVK
jgi:hypothetical protein